MCKVRNQLYLQIDIVDNSINCTLSVRASNAYQAQSNIKEISLAENVLPKNYKALTLLWGGGIFYVHWPGGSKLP